MPKAMEFHTNIVLKINGDAARIDIRKLSKDYRIVHFAINVSILRDDAHHDVFRVDTAHKGLHVQKFWISPEPIYLEGEKKDNYRNEFDKWVETVFENYERWCRMWKEKHVKD